ncbi:CheA signal transduction histidine kinase [Solidesulfovibrio fructosivorans JJ]]|uniref:Chemotaxis protein CheA n=1 Tax=Solidesulfovibrio fructosivorans JJ] TaxID=596151 RepID=E1K1K6_SOLFR|nr:chemotaxis protein CheA [Solidesulfovibrio fructosivorans]EFL49500.1 CheA signal transduction histidine kinase [Solidesulfovibrio fructosivorans JJ]]
MAGNDEMRALFAEEVQENLAELDGALLELEKNPGDKDLVNRIFRAVHTLKGACDMFGISGVVALAHDLESLFAQVREGWRRVGKDLLNAAFLAKDRFTIMLCGEDGPAGGEDPELAARLKELLRSVDMPDDAPAAQAQHPEASPVAPEADAPAPSKHRWRIRFAPSDPGHLAKADPLVLLDTLRGMGEATVRCDLTAVPDLEALEPNDCALRFEVILTADTATVPDADALRDAFFYLENPADVTISPYEETEEDASSDALEWPELPDAEPAPEPMAQSAPPQAAPAPQPAKAPAAGARAEPKRQAAAKKETMQSLRVDAAKLDELVDLVGELVIAQARLTQLASGLSHPSLTSVAEEIERLSNELRDNTLGIRMLPIGTTFSRFRRLVRDLSAEMSKSIELVTEGGETELDKTVIEQLNDPLVHLLRNSIDHGIEPPGERLAAGKPETGSIVLAAEHAGGEVVLSITDDGRGMDPARIRAKAEEKGLVSPEARLTDTEIFNLVFLPGFSTAEKITNVSGRGVGMDVVKRSMDALRGKIDIHSELGKGSRITIKLPLTLAIIDGLQIRAGDDQYIIPLSLVEECVELPREGAETAGRGRTIQLRGEIVPFIRLREAFELAGDAPAIEQVVVTHFEGERAGIAVDEVVGQQQTVIKSLGSYIGAVAGISGATINGDGTMSLILDVPTLVSTVKRTVA